MNKKLSTLLLVSLFLNLLGIIILSALTYYKRDAIKTRIQKMAMPNKQDIEKLALAMNHDIFMPLFGTYKMVGAKKTIKIDLSNADVFKKQVALQFQRSFEDADEETMAEIQKMVNDFSLTSH